MSKQLTLGRGFEKSSRPMRRETVLAEMDRIVPWSELYARIAPKDEEAQRGRASDQASQSVALRNVFEPQSTAWRGNSMNRRKYAMVTGLLALLFAFAAHAHDPAEHAREAQAPDCSALRDAGNGTLDRNDPVIQAMMMQCGDAADQNRGHDDDESPDHRSVGDGHDKEPDVKAQ